MAGKPDCIFCKIVRAELPAARVFESETLMAFLDVNPVVPGHLLLITKDHYVSLLEASDSAAGELGTVLPRLARAVCQGVDAPALNVVANTGREAGQVVDHLHLHFIPRYGGDRLFGNWPHRAYGLGEQESIRRRIEVALAAPST